MLSRWLNEAQRASLTMGACMLLVACSSGPYGGETLNLVTGRVTDQTDQAGIEGIEVCLEIPHDGDTVRTCARTASDGSYTVVDDVYLEQLASDRTSTLAVRDDDGDTHGAYLDQEIAIPPASLPTEIDVPLDRAVN